MSLAAKTKALLTGGANKRRRSLNPHHPPNNGPDNPQDPRVLGPDPLFVPVWTNGSELKQNQNRTETRSTTDNLPRSFTHVPANQRSTQFTAENHQNRRRSFDSVKIRTYRRENAVIPADFFTRCCVSHPPRASSGCCRAAFAVCAARERLERAHKWARGRAVTSIAVCDWLSRRFLVLMGFVVFAFSLNRENNQRFWGCKITFNPNVVFRTM